ncbi:MAG: hypothetical protein IJB24_02200, partial [Clostridia bacterium]|nr:hypothetical protein [Clostridia bacterium]
MNYPTISAAEYTARVNNLRCEMEKQNVDIVIGFSNLLEIGIVRYYCGFAPVNESSAIIIGLTDKVTVC